MTQKYFLKECVLRIHKFLQFFTVFWGDVEGAGTFTPSPPSKPPTKASSRRTPLLGLNKLVSSIILSCRTSKCHFIILLFQ